MQCIWHWRNCFYAKCFGKCLVKKHASEGPRHRADRNTLCKRANSNLKQCHCIQQPWHCFDHVNEMNHQLIAFLFFFLYFSWGNTRSSGANCPQRRSQRLPSTKWESSPQTILSPSLVSGTSCVNWKSSRRLPAKSYRWSKSTRVHQPKSRTLASGCVTIPVPVPTTCTVNTVTCLLVVLSPNATVIWVLVIEPELTASRQVLILICFSPILRGTFQLCPSHRTIVHAQC